MFAKNVTIKFLLSNGALSTLGTCINTVDPFSIDLYFFAEVANIFSAPRFRPLLAFSQLSCIPVFMEHNWQKVLRSNIYYMPRTIEVLQREQVFWFSFRLLFSPPSGLFRG